MAPRKKGAINENSQHSQVEAMGDWCCLGLLDQIRQTVKFVALIEHVVQAIGRQIAAEPAILALCYKRLTSFLCVFLLKQPKVTVPHIAVVYR
jgi:hypothetical protein